MINSISFKGIEKPYKTKFGFQIIPISKNPTSGDIKEAIIATKNNKAHSGLNGRAYFYGQDLVVKKYKSKKEALNYDPQREIKALDMLYEKGISSSQIQRGEFAFTTPFNQTYLVSTKIRGSAPNSIENKFNNENLTSLVGAIAELDRPVRNSKGLFPYSTLIHYDLSYGNLNVTQNEGGIFDFEYMGSVDLSPLYEQMKMGRCNSTLCEISDIPGVVSNLRNFEYRTLMSYLKNLSKEEARQLFIDYLKIKADYHFKRAKFYSSESYELENLEYFGLDYPGETKDELDKMMKKELVHSKTLRTIEKGYYSEEIIKAEAIKMQLAGFVYFQSQFAGANHKINPRQIEQYVREANRFFNEMYEKTKNLELGIYFKDCLDIMEAINGVIGWMDYQYQDPKTREDFNKLSKETQEWQIKNHEKFLSKLTKDYALTLDEVVC